MSAKGILVLALVMLSGFTIAWYRFQSHKLVRAVNERFSDDDLAESGEIPPAYVVVNDYTTEIAANPPDPLMLEDVSALPYPKKLIRLSMQAVLKGALSDQRREALGASYMMLADYQEDVDSGSQDDVGSRHQERVAPVCTSGFVDEKNATALELTVEVTEQGDRHTSIYERWESERQQLAAELGELGVR